MWARISDARRSGWAKIKSKAEGASLFGRWGFGDYDYLYLSIVITFGRSEAKMAKMRNGKPPPLGTTNRAGLIQFLPPGKGRKEGI